MLPIFDQYEQEIAAPQCQAAVQSLSRKEIVEMRGDRYGFAVELFRLWIWKNHIPKIQA